MPDPVVAFQGLVEGIREGAAILSFDRTILTCNRRLAEMLKLECEQVIGRGIFSFLLSEDQPRLETLLQSEPEEFKKLLAQLSGGNAFPLPVELTVKMLKAGGERVFSLLATDLSRRRRAEEQLIFQSQLLANVNDAVIATDDQYRITYWNAAAERTFGWDADEVLGRFARDVLHPVMSEPADAAPVPEQPGELHRETVQQRKDGTPIAVEYRWVALRADDGTTSGYVGVCRDITELKRTQAQIQLLNKELEGRVEERSAELVAAQKNLAEERDKLQAILASIADEIWLVDVQGNTSALNAAAIQGLGFDRADGVPLSALVADLEILNPDGTLRTMEENPLIRSLQGEVCRGEEIVRHRQTGERRYRQFTTSPVRNSEGEIVAAVSVARDITDRKRAEEEIRRLFHDLEVSASQVEAERRRWKGMVEGIADEVWICDAQGRMSLINVPEATQMGLEEFENKTVQEVYDEVDILNLDGEIRPYEEAPLLRALKTGAPVRGEEIMRHKGTGRMRYRHFSAAPMRDTTGAITGAIAIVRDITREKQAEEHLRAALQEASTTEARLRTVLDQLPSGVTIRDALTGQAVMVNEEARRILGTPVLTLQQASRYEGLHPDGRPYRTEEWPLTRALAHGETIRGEEIELRGGAGSRVVIRANAAPVRDPDGKIIAGVAVFNDITEEKRIREALQQSEEQLRVAAQAANIGIWNWNPRTGDVKVSANWKVVFGVSPETNASFETWRNALHPDDRDAAVNALTHASETRTEYNVEYRVVWPDGTVRWIVDRGRGTYDEQGRPINFAGVNVDITERKRAEEERARTLEELRLSEERFRTALKSAPITVYNLDRDLKYTWAFDPKEAGTYDRRGKEAEQIIPKFPPEFKAIKRGVIQSGIGTRQEVQALGPDGQTHIYDLTIDPLRDESGTIVGITCAAVDITEHKRAAARIQELNRALEQRAVQLEIANKELESFSYSVSHDLRTPLATIDGFVQVLREDYGSQLPAEGQHYLDLVREGTRQMEALIQSLLSLARLSRHAIQKRPINMTRLVAEAFETVQSDPKRPDLTFDLHDLPKAEADPILLKQVWVNLIANAVKFTRNCGQARIEIGCEPCDGEAAVYYVRDNGVGFDMNEAHRLFSVFQRLHGEQEYEGTGVGLAIVQRIVNRHGGRVWAEGEVGQGATFYFTLNE